MEAKLTKDRRRKANRRGMAAEYLAALYLTFKGYRILSLRFKTALGEVDIVAKRGDLIIFCEVKSRADIGQAVDAVHFEAQRRIRAASDLWLSRFARHHHFSVRYDIIVVRPYRWPYHLVDAF